jgi:hypothetical protein
MKRQLLLPLLNSQSGGGGGGGGAEYIAPGALYASSSAGTVVAPADSLTDDMLVLVSHTVDSNVPITTPAGWTVAASKVFASASSLSIFYKVATGDGTANNVSVGAKTRQYTHMFALRGPTALDSAASGAIGQTPSVSRDGATQICSLNTTLTPSADAIYMLGFLSTYIGAEPATGTRAGSQGLGVLHSTYSSVGNDSYVVVAGGGWPGATATTNPFTMAQSLSNSAIMALVAFK